MDNNNSVLITENTLLNHSSINILFLGFDALEMDLILSVVRSAQVTPRGKQLSSMDELNDIVKERAWDILLSAPDELPEMSTYAVIRQLYELEKDIPCLKLSDNLDSDAQLEAMRHGIRALLPSVPGDLLLYTIQRELEELDSRRKLRKVTANLALIEQHYQNLIDHSSLPCCYLRNDEILYANKAFYNLMAADPEAHGVKALSTFMEADQRKTLQACLNEEFQLKENCDAELAITLHNSLDEEVPVRMYLQNGHLHGHPCIIMLMVSKEQIQEHQEEDSLTGLKNQRYLLNKLSETIQIALNGGNDAHLLYAQLTDFDTISEEHGEEVAEALLLQIADDLAPRIGRRHLFSRVSPSSFAIIFHNPDDRQAEKLASLLIQRISAFSVGSNGQEVSSRCAIGIVAINDSSPSSTEVIERAQFTVSKIVSGNGFLMYRRALANIAQAQRESSIKLVIDAIHSGRINLLYQPVVAIDQETTENYYEVLVRLMSVDGEEIRPNTFMSDVERSDAMVALDRVIMHNAMKALQQEKQRGRTNTLFINLSGRSLSDRDMAKIFQQQLEKRDLSADQVIFQISETDAALNLSDCMTLAKSLHDVGARLCIKHFGSSPSSNVVFEDIQAEFVKIDSSFMQDIQSGELHPSALKQQPDPVRSRGSHLIAPMVENTKVIPQLFNCGIELIQGYYIQKPLDSMEYDCFDS